MLPNETLHDVLRFLSRPCLDAVEVATRRLNALIMSRLGEHSLRRVSLTIRDTSSAVLFRDASDVKIVLFDKLSDALSRVFFCEARIAELDSVCHVPTRYASAELLIRAFSELLFASELHLNDDRLWVANEVGEWGYILRFFELPCIQRCRMLRFCNSDIFYPLKGQLVEWLFSGGPKKRFAMRIDTPIMLSGFDPEAMIERFQLANDAAEFELTISSYAHIFYEISDYPSVEIVNKRTCETFTVKSVCVIEDGRSYVQASYVRRPLSMPRS